MIQTVFHLTSHKDELHSLKDKDPEFFQYLQDNDANLLTFGEDDGEDEDLDGEIEGDIEDLELSEDEAEEDDEASVSGEIPASTRKEKRDVTVVEVTEDLLNETVESAKSGSMGALKKLLSIFRAACLPSTNDPDDDDDEGTDKSQSAFNIPSPEVYQLVMLSVTDNAHVAMYQQLGLEELSHDCLSKIDKHPKWKKVQFMVLSYFKSMLHTLASLAVASKQEQVSVFLITSLEAYLPLLSPMPT